MVYSTASQGRRAHQWPCVAVDFKSNVFFFAFSVGTEKEMLKCFFFYYGKSVKENVFYICIANGVCN